MPNTVETSGLTSERKEDGGGAGRSTIWTVLGGQPRGHGYSPRDPTWVTESQPPSKTSKYVDCTKRNLKNRNDFFFTAVKGTQRKNKVRGELFNLKPDRNNFLHIKPGKS